MDSQINFIIKNYRQVSVDDTLDLLNYVNLIKSSIMKSDKVYIFRAYNHIMRNNNLIQWILEQEIGIQKQISLQFEKLEKIYVIKSSDDSDIFVLELTDPKVKESFLKRFRINYSDFRHCMSKQLEDNYMLVDNPMYDQYDFVFVKNDIINVWTSLHELLLFMNEECK